jgi:hypothetical protein
MRQSNYYQYYEALMYMVTFIDDIFRRTAGPDWIGRLGCLSLLGARRPRKHALTIASDNDTSAVN